MQKHLFIYPLLPQHNYEYHSPKCSMDDTAISIYYIFLLYHFV